MRYPEFLKPGGRMGFIAPSFGCPEDPYRTRFDEMLKLFRGMGYKTVLGPNCYAADGIGKSNTPERCGAEINDFFLNDRSDVILSCGGGETMCEDLSYVDFEGIKAAKPKLFMGFSDNTNLTFTLPTLCDTAAIYGPNAATFGMNPWHESLSDALMAICGTGFSLCNYNGWSKPEPRPETAEENETEQDPLATYVINEPFRITYGGSATVKAEFSGRLIGGCLDCLAVLCGTKYDRTAEFAERYKDDGIIWVLEACDLNPIGIRRTLWQLESAGWFRYVNGFMIGRALHYDDDYLGMNRINAVTGILDKYNVPILMDLDIGHLAPMMPLVMGSFAEVKALRNELTVDQKLI